MAPVIELVDAQIGVALAGKGSDDERRRITRLDFRPALLSLRGLPIQHSPMGVAVQPLMMVNGLREAKRELAAVYRSHSYTGVVPEHDGLRCTCIDFIRRVNLPVPTPCQRVLQYRSLGPTDQPPCRVADLFCSLK